IEQGRPTKRDRRELDGAARRHAEWDDRWSASLPPEDDER
ncbi:RNA-binding S4 domain-containing protein, partial [Variovorax sp. Varisp62]